MPQPDDLSKRRASLSSAKQAILSKWIQAKPSASAARAIPRRSGQEPAPASFAQQRLWYLDQLFPNNPFYNLPAAVRLTGPLNGPVLERSLNEIVRRHEILRTTFAQVQGQPVQVVAPSLTVPLPVIDLCEVPAAEREEAAWQLGTEQARRPFDLARGPLLRTILLRLDKEEHVLLLTWHHIVTDGWSLGVVWQELAAIYTAFSAGKPSPLPEISLQYADYAVWQRQGLQGQALETQLAYWKRYLKGAPTVLTLPTCRPRVAGLNPAGKTLHFELPKPLTEALKALSEQEGSTLFMTLLAAFSVLLYRYTGETDIVVGTPIANRNQPELWEMIGFFANTLVLRTNLAGNPTFRQLLSRIRQETWGVYDYQDIPFERLVEELHPQRDPSINPLFQIMFVLQNVPPPDLKMPGLAWSFFPLNPSNAIFDCFFNLIEDEQGLSGAMDYNAALFEPAMMAQLMDHFQTLLEALVVRADEPIEAIAALIPIQRLDLVVASTFTADLIEPSLAFWSQQFQVPARIRLAPYSQALQQLLDPTSLFARYEEGCNLVLLRLEDWAQAPEGVQVDFFERLEQNTRELLEALRDFRQRSAALCVVCLCPPSNAVMADWKKAEFLHDMERRLAQQVQAMEGVVVLAGTKIASRYHVSEVNDPQTDHAGHIPYTMEFFTALGTAVARAIFVPHSRYKAVILDCDQTLWEGLCGEDGPAEVKVQPAHAHLQEIMAGQRQAGRQVCLCSQNEEKDVVEAFRLHPDMPLKLKDLAGWRVNWNSTAANIQALADDLYLPLNSLIYMSGNPVECAQVQACCPDVLTVALPDQPDIPDFLDHVWVLDARAQGYSKYANEPLTPLCDEDLERLLLIRHFELSLLDLFSMGKLNGTTHTCWGQEYIPVALSALLSDRDFVFSNHRGHGHYISRFNDPAGLLAEIMGREGAVCNGAGGSQHICRDHYLSTGVQGESLPVAVGVALYLKRAQSQGLAMVYMGDGTWGEGVVYESLNMAQLWRLPLLVIVENNHIAQSTPIRLHMAGSIEGRVRAFGMNYQKVSTVDVNKIRELVGPLVQDCRTNCSPWVIEFDTIRLGPHSKGDDTRDKAELASLDARDWYTLYRKQFPAQFERLEPWVFTQVSDLVGDVERRPWVTWTPL